MQILDVNENAFYKRYEISLSKEAGRVTEPLYGNYRERFDLIKGSEKEVVKKIPESALFIMIVGFSGGDFLRVLTESIFRTVHVLVWEPEWEAFLYVASLTDISDLIANEQLDIVIGRGEESTGRVKEAIRENVDVQNMDYAVMLCSPGFDDIYVSEVGELKKLYEDSLFDVGMDVATRSHFAQIPCKNEMYAMSVLHRNHTADQLFRSISTRDIPVIIVSTGPSLEKNVDELKNIGNRALVVSLARSVDTLSEREIRYHFAAMLDAAVGEEYMDSDEKAEARMLLDVKCVQGMQRKYDGNIVYCGMNPDLYPIKRVEDTAYAFSKGGSVATAVYGMFQNAGFKTIILVGQDLAFSEDGFSHAGGELEVDERKTYEVEGISGGIVKTRDDWYAFLRFYEDMIEKHPETKVVDATEGGALIHGSEILTLEEALEKYCMKEYPIDEWIENMPKMNPDIQGEIEGIMKRHYQKALSFKKELTEAISINNLLVKAIREGDFFSERSKAYCKRYDELYNIIVQIDNEDMILSYSEDVIQNYVQKALTVEKDEDFDKKLILEEQLYSELLMRCEEMLKYMTELYPGIAGSKDLS
ncbi:MAG: DUF115 domain-containing protein [Lachnospiraceae bacterium]|nr:DUF115 domain-containing protein [Lachnospiraceae bacterium]